MQIVQADQGVEPVSRSKPLLAALGAAVPCTHESLDEGHIGMDGGATA